MAVVTRKSGPITDRDATPRVLSNARLQDSKVRHARGVATLVSGDSIASKLLFFSVPSNAVMTTLPLSAPDIGTTTAGDVGLYRTTDDGGAVVDADFFKAAVVLNAAAQTKTELLFGNIVTVANSEKPLWEHLALTEDPGVMYDVVMTLTAAADAAGSVLLEGEFTL